MAGEVAHEIPQTEKSPQSSCLLPSEQQPLRGASRTLPKGRFPGSQACPALTATQASLQPHSSASTALSGGTVTQKTSSHLSPHPCAAECKGSPGDLRGGHCSPALVLSHRLPSLAPPCGTDDRQPLAAQPLAPVLSFCPRPGRFSEPKTAQPGQQGFYQPCPPHLETRNVHG